MNVFDFSAKTIDGESKSLSGYRGRVLLIVNVASACGKTPQYEGLQKLYAAYREQGLEVLGFPCNQFGEQEPGTEADIKTFCETRYNVTFPMFAKIQVNGDKAHPLYSFLVEHTPESDITGEIEWNFVKFLIDRQGSVVKRYSYRTEPSEIEADIARQLKA